MARTLRGLIALAALTVVGGTLVVAQVPPDNGGGGNNGGQNDGRRNGGGGRGNFDPAQFRQRMMDRMRETLKASPEEMEVLMPKIEAVTTAQRAVSTGGMGMMFGGGRGGQGGGGPGGGMWGNQTPSEVQNKARELNELLAQEGATPEQIKAKTEELRQARARAKEALAKAQSELRELLTPRQEAAMVAFGILE